MDSAAEFVCSPRYGVVAYALPYFRLRAWRSDPLLTLALPTPGQTRILLLAPGKKRAQGICSSARNARPPTKAGRLSVTVGRIRSHSLQNSPSDALALLGLAAIDHAVIFVNA
jgi:hypothetical protein